MAKCVEEHAGVARILGGDQGTALQRFERAHREIAQIADGCRNDVQATGCRVCHYTSGLLKAG